MSWISPLAPYLATSSKNLNNPCDLAVFVIRSLRLNGDNTFDASNVDMAIKQVRRDKNILYSKYILTMMIKPAVQLLPTIVYP